MIADLAIQTGPEDILRKHVGQPARAIFIKTDVTDWTQLGTAFDLAILTFGRLDIVCPGAGIFEPPGLGFWHFDSGPPATGTSTYKTLDIDITHPIRCTQLAIDFFLRQRLGHGIVLHISSVAAQLPGRAVPLYSASKAAISHFVRSLDFLEGTHNIRVNAVAPANVRTKIWTEAGRADNLDETRGDEWMTPERIADVMLDMVTKEQYVGGTIWETGWEAVRKIELLNDPGPNLKARGFTYANVGAAQREVDGNIEKFFGLPASPALIL